MVPVRKPGRPLSSCPHPASRPCSCAAVTAAIPRKQTCHCGPSEKPSKSNGGVKKESELSSGSSTPPGEGKTTSSTSFKVQKQSSKSNHNKKQSIDPVGLVRMDPNQLNIMNSLNGVPQYHATNSNGVPGAMTSPSTFSNIGGFGTRGFHESGTPPIPIMAQPLVPQFPQPYLNGTFTNGHASSPSNGSTTNGDQPAAKASCCGGAKKGSSSPTIPVTETESPAPETKSCCSSKNEIPSATEPPQLGGIPSINGNAMAFNPALVMQNGMHPFFQQPTIFNYPPQYGSYMQPLQPDQWRQVMATMMFGQPPQQGLGIPNITPIANPETSNPESWTSHQCGCGDSCQCVGCAAHPYNEATQNYVRSAWNTMINDSQTHSTRTNGKHVPNGEPAQPSEDLGDPNSGSKASATNGDSTMSPVPPQTPSDATSGLADEQNLSANDFFFVSYPFSDSCEGDMGSCPCGDDCQCIGCAIHGNNSANDNVV